MLTLFSKSLRALTPEDIECLITDAYPEGDDVEFKQELPATGSGAADPWMNGGPNIGDRARNEILDEIAAFANGHGGHLVLGIAETTDRPARAERVTPVPRSIELAERLRLQVRDCIDPQFPVVDIAGIVTTPDGAGVVVIRIPQSRSAPHRVKQTLNCCVRRADRCEKMTMREIQDLTLQRDRGLARVDAAFAERANNFRKKFDGYLSFIRSEGHTVASGIRITLIPVGADLYLERIIGIPELRPELRIFDAKIDDHSYPLHLPRISGDLRPIIRGARYEYRSKEMILTREAYCNGTVEYSLIEPIKIREERFVHPEWVLGLALNAIITAHRFRSVAGARGCEYGFEGEVLWTEGSLHLTSLGGTAIRSVGKLEPNPVSFPRMSLGEASEISRLIGLLERDLFNAAGIDTEGKDLVVTIPPELLE